MKRNKITISFLPNDLEVWDFIQQKKATCNISEYVRRLIQQDMTNSPLLIDEEKMVEKIIQALQNSEVVLKDKDNKAIEVLLPNSETKNTILNLF